MTKSDKFVYDHSEEIAEAYVGDEKYMIIKKADIEKAGVDMDKLSFSLFLTGKCKKTVKCAEGLVVYLLR